MLPYRVPLLMCVAHENGIYCLVDMFELLFLTELGRSSLWEVAEVLDFFVVCLN